LLDTKNKVIGVDMVSQGSGTSSLVHPAEVYKSALLASVASVIFVHSHPSGDPEPSIADKELTRQLKEAGDLLAIEVLDHVIIGRGEFHSFADKGEL
jgi:DNA repair protein RadC